jgi:hypothetical protein
MRLNYPLALIALGAALLVPVQEGASASPARLKGHTTYEERRTPSDAFLALDWMNAQRGWALISGACGHSRCPAVYETQNGGRAWRRLSSGPSSGCSDTGWCIDAVLFVTPRIGYLYGPALLMTTDGGQRWMHVSRLQIESMAVSGSNVCRLVSQGTGCPGPCRPLLQRSIPGSRTWTRVPGWRDVSEGFGEQFVASGRNLYTAFYGHIAGGEPSAHAAIEMSHDSGRSWLVRGDPCGYAGGREEDALTVAANGSSLGILCISRSGQGPSFVAFSGNAGRTFTRSAALPLNGPAQLAVGADREIAVGNGGMVGSGKFTYELALSTKDSHNWRIAVRDPEPLYRGAGPGSLQYTSSQRLWWVGYPYHAWQSRDGGHMWRRSSAP